MIVSMVLLAVQCVCDFLMSNFAAVPDISILKKLTNKNVPFLVLLS